MSALAPGRKGVVLGNGQAGRVDVAAVAGTAVKVVPGGMMLGMLPAPVRIGRQREDRAEPAQRVVGPTRCEEGAMTTIVLDDEGPYGQSCGRQHQQWHQPPPAIGKAD